MDIPWLWLPLIFFTIAFFYSIVGFAGGSSYLAVLALMGLPYDSIPSMALVCNVIVASTAFWHFWRGGHFHLKKVLPFVILSVPMAYWGGRVRIGHEVFSLLLGLSLAAASLRLFFPGKLHQETREISWPEACLVGLPAGAILGFLSGLVGIGGGIFLAPLLLLMRWTTVKEAAAASSFFILVNSLSGLAGHLEKGSVDFSLLAPLGLAVFVGGFAGSRLGSFHVPHLGLQRVLACLILFVSIKLLMGIF